MTKLISFKRDYPVIECDTCQGVAFALTEKNEMICLECKMLMDDLVWGYREQRIDDQKI